MKSEVEGKKKVRVYFGDDLKLNNKISFETFVYILNGTDSSKIKFNNKEVGTLNVIGNDFDSNIYRYERFKSFNEYYNYVTQNKNPTSNSKISITLNGLIKW